ncbi:16S rRNA (uracil(1498)-N(3))-methyltransferase [Leifsonia sp. H3M29-4]|uniref:16S rRNA (uracil(1498)-N(3))-methyltransferase n=1 Tax=Salinibacterium metalliresistens TaxID=3031321 RepID=UPI0023DBC4AF|nr:16S rRNA (uracil(1498)-N(3))-methyltransferase [Salinibacterium metalliresistens]MDF1478865.1 16S rRNA (uracil(1498)-N(3))-methyltransferase [Salinibacterium metalliresistens]
MAHRYLDESFANASVGDRAVLGAAESRHAVTVSRVAVGEAISVGDGAGLVLGGTVVTADPTGLAFDVQTIERVERRSPAVFLVQALAKGDRDELAVQAATELGVDGVIPWSAARSVSRWEGAKVAKGVERWRAIVREASKQSLRAWVPDVLDLVSTKQLAAMASAVRMLVLDPTAELPLSALQPDGRDLVLVVGPEGGIAPQELEQLTAAGAELMRLGPEVLRTSTAGPAALAALNTPLGRW